MKNTSQYAKISIEGDEERTLYNASGFIDSEQGAYLTIEDKKISCYLQTGNYLGLASASRVKPQSESGAVSELPRYRRCPDSENRLGTNLHVFAERIVCPSQADTSLVAHGDYPDIT